MQNFNSQKYKILKYLQTGHSLTSLQAIEKWGITRLAAQILFLKNKGHVIKATRIKTNKGTQIAEYRLIQKP